ncbi:MAG: monovalent cation/H+ antiporter complex subunit F [Candidatus Omnitrophica bacterium]|nr:monovalent cation/H+ antiporter complex subunit F [Candidatus Omnitrophota bacterium]MCM8807131.1 monovalent cation/H+ antiporter complex subunit F [Candidatus Omnitrophota bacterium]
MNTIFIFLGICIFMCIYRIVKGPTPADRSVAIDILGLVIIVYCVFYSLITGIDFYMNIAIAWSIIGFVSSLTLAKFLEGRKFDD